MINNGNINNEPLNSNPANIQNSGFLAEPTFTFLVYKLYLMMIVLSILRILTLEFFQMISDGLGALMIFFFLFGGRGKCLSIFLLVNGILGLVSALQRSFWIYDYWSENSSIFVSVVLLITFYSVIVYSLEVLIAIIGIRRYKWETMIQNVSVLRTVDVQGNSNNQQTGFVAFSGQGQAVGGN